MARGSVEKTIPPAVRGVLKELGGLISMARREKRISQAGLAKRVEVGRMTIVRMERGSPEIAIGYYLTAAWVLGLPVLAWSDFAGTRKDTMIASVLEMYRRQLPKRVRGHKENLNNDF